jgi:site-specific recombinase XerD
MQYQEPSKSKGAESAAILPPGSLHPLQGEFFSDDFYKEGFRTVFQLYERKPAKSQRQITRDRILGKIEQKSLPGKEHFIRYIRFKFQKNCKPNTICSAYSIISQFLAYLRDTQRADLADLCRSEIEGFLERQQDRKLKPRSIGTHLAAVYAFIRFLADEGIVDTELLSRRISIRLPDPLPKAIEREDVDLLLSVIEDTRNRAMMMLLLRTGMRIGELLNTQMGDICLEEQTIRIHESVKTGGGRVVFFSNDAAEALYEWLLVRDYWKERLFYGQGRLSMTYAGARKVFVKYIGKARLSGKGYTIHCLRHTFATNLLNAGTPIEVVRDLLGHSSLEQTQQYTKLSDRTREAEFFRAMAIIEGENKNEPD